MKRILWSLALAAAAGACGKGDPETVPSRQAPAPPASPSGAPPQSRAAVDHSGHGAGAVGGVAGHGAETSPQPAGIQGGAHGGHGGAGHPPEASAAGAGHAHHPGTRSRGGAPSGAGHAEHAATRGRPGGEQAHEAHHPARASAGGAAHAGHGAAPAAERPPRAVPTGHAGHGAGTPIAADPATQRLLTLGRELVRDPAVQQEIERDTALSRAWRDPDVRRLLDARP